MKLIRLLILIVLITIAACSGLNESELYSANDHEVSDHFMAERTTSNISSPPNIDPEQYSSESYEWGEFVTGVKTQLDTEEQAIALTFDACGGPYGREYDEELIEFLIEHDIPATLFVNKDWIEHNEETFIQLAENPLFQIENHGTDHLPLSVSGRTAWGIDGTNSPEEVYEEVQTNQQYIYELTGETPSYFRSGTAYYDEVAVQMIQDMGLEAVNYNVLGDAGGTYSSEQVEQSLLQSEPGSIALLHMNQPSSGTRDGVMNAIPQLIEQGYEFVLLDEYELK
ncbi:peptidoglycan/xylan/chitin deacetylase (PgdA/CDA1 family) [Alkalibacillus filiformis]|uniref:Peptidoglycan/xylan/chitin deacetylase (PgdA/CDA1 family) n=1 Tax=Alkalibacillus filiformis TaxID=200990 RepID=A0ABU0DXC2_9BACI|nr:polysaccharide deacetylase family protein [Alkalibacillus filiformis]MDQ0352959.1 peptidoglycan/xylan/chitin deacetylase (PgdA/CDA1 family) [Alkalibacillus filiformis]